MVRLKKSRVEHPVLIAVLDEAAQQAGQNEITPNPQIAKAKAKSTRVKSDYEQLLEKFNSLLLGNYELMQKMKQI